MSFIASSTSVPLNSIISIMPVIAPYGRISGLSAAQFDTH